MEAELDPAALSKIWEFLRAFASRNGWGDGMADRLEAVGEEALLSLLRPEEDETLPYRRRRLRLVAARADGGAVLEFVVAPTGENIEDRLAVLGESRRRDRDRARSFTPAAAAPRILRAPPAIPRRRYRHRPGEAPGKWRQRPDGDRPPASPSIISRHWTALDLCQPTRWRESLVKPACRSPMSACHDGRNVTATGPYFPASASTPALGGPRPLPQGGKR